MPSEHLKNTCERFHEADEALRAAGPDEVEAAVKKYLECQGAHQRAIAQARGESEESTDAYAVELTIRDARGRKFGAQTTVEPEMLERVLNELARDAFEFCHSPTPHNREGRERFGFERIGGEEDE